MSGDSNVVNNSLVVLFVSLPSTPAAFTYTTATSLLLQLPNPSLLNHAPDNLGREDEGLCQDSEE